MPGDSVTDRRRHSSQRAAATRRRFLRPGEASTGEARERWRLIVEGRVQGVGYRQACCATARSLGLGGWVRNLENGAVEVQAEGRTIQLTELERWCGCGPSQAAVRGVCTVSLALTGEDWFEVRP